jgi:hypothetical protein
MSFSRATMLFPGLTPAQTRVPPSGSKPSEQLSGAFAIVRLGLTKLYSLCYCEPKVT